MPPGYWDLLSALGYEGIANNLKQTSFGKYGRQADRAKFKPAWATNILRSTDSGAKIRQGQYDDSPGKFSRQTMANAALAEMEARLGGAPLELDPSEQQQYSHRVNHVQPEYEDEETADIDDEVQDLQKMLAQKMAELARLQAEG